MGQEIEAKIQISDEAAFRAAVEQLGATYLGAWCETDIFFDHPNERLIEKDMALRMRLDVPLDEAGQHCDLSPKLTYKGPREKGRLKVRPEHEVRIPDVEGMRQVLHWLNYLEVFCYQKIRRRWDYQGAEITLDQVPMLGLFAEVEAGDEQTVHDLLTRLGQAQGQTEPVTRGYVHMLQDKLGHMPSHTCLYADGHTADVVEFVDSLRI